MAEQANGAAETTEVVEEGLPIEVVVPVAAVAPPPPAPEPVVGVGGAKKLEEMDIVKLENSFLKIENLRKARQISERDIQNADQQISQLQQSLIVFREQLSKKYGVDLTKARITPDGTIIPNANPGPTSQAGNPIAAAIRRN